MQFAALATLLNQHNDRAEIARALAVARRFAEAPLELDVDEAIDQFIYAEAAAGPLATLHGPAAPAWARAAVSAARAFGSL
jgi:hypothetical protein